MAVQQVLDPLRISSRHRRIDHGLQRLSGNILNIPNRIEVFNGSQIGLRPGAVRIGVGRLVNCRDGFQTALGIFNGIDRF